MGVVPAWLRQPVLSSLHSSELARVSDPCDVAEAECGVLAHQDFEEPGAGPAREPGTAEGGVAGVARVGTRPDAETGVADAWADQAGGGEERADGAEGVIR
jgi:hypothetical protein